MTKEAFLKKLGQNIESVRKEAGLSQTEVALRIGRPRQNVSRIEKGGHNPSAYVLYEIATVLKVSIKDLLDFK